MIDLLADVAAFHAKFRHFIGTKLHKVPEVPYAIRRFRMERIEEEAKELIEAITQGKICKVAREGIDLIYVVLGTFVIFGIPFYPIWKAVHSANMAKTYTGPLDKPGKPEGWQSPDERIDLIIEGVFAEQEEDARSEKQGEEDQTADEGAARIEEEADKATPPDTDDKGSESSSN